MTIANLQSGAIGARTYEIQGPFNGSGPIPSSPYRFGETTAGDAEGEFVYVAFTPPTVPFTLQQGQLVAWDTTFTAALLTTANAARGQNVGTVFLGGRFGDAAPAPFAATLPAAGTYGLWVQRNGVSLVAAAASAAPGNVATTTTTPGQADAPASPATGTKTIFGLYFPAASAAFTATTAAGSAALATTGALTGIYPGQTVSGAGIPANALITAIAGPSGNATVTLGTAATATATGVAVTATGLLEATLKRPFINQTN